MKTTEKILYGWLLLAVLALAFAGLFAMLLALARTPVVENLLPLGRDYIYVALVGHVILAFVLWFLAFEGFLWVYSTSLYVGRRMINPHLGWLGLWFSCAGVALVVISAVLALGAAELSNYVPVLMTPVFYIGLAAFALGVLLTLVNAFTAAFRTRLRGGRLPVVTVGMMVAAVAVLSALLCFALSWYFQYSTGRAFLDFERLFWGGGHVLQFANTVSIVTVWVFLTEAVTGREPVGGKLARSLFAFYLLFILSAPFIYLVHDTSTQAHKDGFTFLMTWGLGPSTAVFAASIIMLLVRSTPLHFRRPGFSCLVLSMAIFTVGGLISFTIKGVNTIIPAHYHCVIGGVTIAFMGFFYEIAPVVKRRVFFPALASFQPYIYFSGVLLFALGLYIAGAYGAARKSLAGSQDLQDAGRLIGMSVMGLGGLVSIAGGVAFVVNALFTLLGRKGSS